MIKSREEQNSFRLLLYVLYFIRRSSLPCIFHAVHDNIFLLPVVIPVMAYIAHLAAFADILSEFQNDVRKFQVFLPFFFHGVISKQRAEDVSGDCAGRITVTFMIYSGDNAL